MEKSKKELKIEQKSQELPAKMSYEQLENVAHQMSEQSRQLYQRLQEANMTNAFKRLDYLFKVLDNGHMFGPEFVNKCVEEIQETLTLEPEETPETQEEKGE